MDHIDQHTLELYALGSEELPLSARQIERHLSECLACREFLQEMREFYGRAAERVREPESQSAQEFTAIVSERSERLSRSTPKETSFIRWEPNAIGRFVGILRSYPAAVGSALFFMGALVWAAITILPGLFSDNNPAYAILNPGFGRLEVFNRADQLLWDAPVKGAESARLVERRDRLPHVVVTDLDGDGRNEVVASLEGVRGFTAREGAVIVAFAEDGQTLWQVGPEKPVRYRGEAYPSAWLAGGMVVADFDGDGKKEIVCRAISGRSPAAILRFDMNGSLQGEYWHYGHLTLIQTVASRQGGRIRLLAGGSNDSADGSHFGHVVVALLDPRLITGTTEATTTPGFGHTPSTAERFWVRLPNTDVNIRYRAKAGVDAITVDTSAFRRAVQVWWVASVPDGKLVLEYVFGPDFSLRSLKSSDATTRVLTNLQNRGEISPEEVAQLIPSLKSGVEYWDGSKWRKEPYLLAAVP